MFFEDSIKKILNRETISYIIFGVLTTIINYCVYFLFTIVFEINYFIANMVSWIVSVIFAYLTNKFFVFALQNLKLDAVLKEMISFISTRVISLIMEIAILYTFVDLIGISDFIVKIFAGFLVIILNYLLSKIFVFVSR